MENKINCSKLIESIRVNRKDEPKQSRDEGVGCNLDNEILPEDEELIRNFQLTEEQIRLKNTNAQEFWKSLAETARCDLNDHLDDNKELYRLNQLIKEDHTELMKENLKLNSLVKEAAEIVNQYNNL